MNDDERSGLPVGPEVEPMNMLPEGQDLSKFAAGPSLKSKNMGSHQIVGMQIH